LLRSTSGIFVLYSVVERENQIIMSIKYRSLLALFGAGALVVASASGTEREKATSASGAVTEKATSATTQTDKGKTTKIDLRPQMKQMKLKEGRNMVYQGSGYKLSALVKGGKVARWVATDTNGRPLPTTVAKGVVTCEVCVTISTGNKGSSTSCVAVDCSILEKAKTAEKAQ
jgi:hypothetical protein